VGKERGQTFRKDKGGARMGSLFTIQRGEAKGGVFQTASKTRRPKRQPLLEPNSLNFCCRGEGGGKLLLWPKGKKKKRTRGCLKFIEIDADLYF